MRTLQSTHQNKWNYQKYELIRNWILQNIFQFSVKENFYNQTRLVVCKNTWRKKKEAIINSFIYRNFNYCLLTWHFRSGKFLNKIGQIQKRCLRITLNDNGSDYENLLKKSSQTTMNIKRIRILAIELFKTINNLNSPFLKKTVKVKVNARVWPNDYIVKTHSIAAYGDKFVTVPGPKIWSSLPENVKSESSYRRFKEYINTWFEPKYYCTYCKYFTRKT